jgi:hypothetical protein
MSATELSDSIREAPAPQASLNPMARLRARLRDVAALRRLKRRFSEPNPRIEEAQFRASDVAQKQLVAQWKGLHADGTVLSLDQVGFSRFSEFEEDGQLLYLLTLAGMQSRVVVEISSQDGRVCMASNLIIHHRFKGFLFDGDPIYVEGAHRFFGQHPATRSAPPVAQARWFTRDNVNAILSEAGVPPEIDVLSLDVDGIDLHLWQALSITRPRILICEFNNAVPSDIAVTVPYRHDFDFSQLPADRQMFRSASLAAYAVVSRRKGYRFVGTNALGFNAIFLRDDVLRDEFPERPLADIDTISFVQEMRAKWWPKLERMDWMRIV